MKIGIVGLPNVGKSTLFNALMQRAMAAAANHPFTTIEPNVGIVDVPDDRLPKLAAIANPEKVVPATVTFVDIAGLIAGAHKGEGLGNQFLAHIREAEALALVLRCFRDDKIVHVAGEVNPADDAKTVLLELLLADLATLEKRLEAAEDELQPVYRLVARALEAGQLAAHALANLPTRLKEKELRSINELQLLTAKPILYVANVAEAEAAKSADDIIKQWNLGPLLQEAPGTLIPISAKVEAEVSQLAAPETREYLASLGLGEPGLNRLIRSSYHLLDLASFFTAGPKEVRAWTFRRGAKAPACAGVIHTDFEKGFIRAEVIAYEDYISYGGEQGTKLAGKLRSEGKDYLVQDGDVVHFRFNV